MLGGEEVYKRTHPQYISGKHCEVVHCQNGEKRLIISTPCGKAVLEAVFFSRGAISQRRHVPLCGWMAHRPILPGNGGLSFSVVWEGAKWMMSFTDKCHNGGYKTIGGSCICPTFFEGLACERVVCANNGTRVRVAAFGREEEMYECTHPQYMLGGEEVYKRTHPQYISGKHCEVVHCQNEGRFLNDGTCLCVGGWHTGQFCQGLACERIVCANNGTRVRVAAFGGEEEMYECTHPQYMLGGEEVYKRTHPQYISGKHVKWCTAKTVKKGSLSAPLVEKRFWKQLSFPEGRFLNDRTCLCVGNGGLSFSVVWEGAKWMMSFTDKCHNGPCLRAHCLRQQRHSGANGRIRRRGGDVRVHSSPIMLGGEEVCKCTHPQYISGKHCEVVHCQNGEKRLIICTPCGKAVLEAVFFSRGAISQRPHVPLCGWMTHRPILPEPIPAGSASFEARANDQTKQRSLPFRLLL
ncbi:hypothetical protein niasHS_009710 [Heterodera schachtii]|uniref:EGF-like domain-containing protein n=1 Tax=Heterodera schachtii TaxID=97005 RepID=A0ABD2IYN7_HETSC